MMKKTKAVLLIVLAVTAAVCVTACTRGDKKEEKIEVTEDEMSQYRDMIGDSMDIKKAVFILFEDEDECKAFIEEHGKDKEPQMAGKGIIPLMEDGYYNIVGKPVVEEAFDNLKDGEYLKEPLVYSDMYCYLKRIGVESPLNDDEKLKELIINDKRQRGAE